MGGYQSDLVVTELRKAPGMELEKEALQKATALGTDDLRQGVAEALETGMIAETEQGYRFVEDGEMTAVPIPEDAQPAIAVGETPGAPVPGEEEPGEGGVVATPDAELPERPDAEAARTVATDVDPAYRATFEVIIDFRLDEPGSGDQAAANDCAEILSQVQAAVKERWPDLSVQGRVLKLVAYDQVREIFSADG